VANPAERLHGLLNGWRSTNSWPDATEQRIAARHIESIDELLDQMDAMGMKTHVYRRHFERWIALVYHSPHDWSGSKHVDDRALENLELLADRLDGLVPKLQDGGLAALRKYAENARTFVSEDDSIGDPLKQHVLRVIAHLDWCIAHHDRVSDSDLQEAVERLFASMVRTATHSNDKQKWFDWIMNNTVWPFTVSVAAAIPAQALLQLLGGT
jgi:hypothetical protein